MQVSLPGAINLDGYAQLLYKGGPHTHRASAQPQPLEALLAPFLESPIALERTALFLALPMASPPASLSSAKIILQASHFSNPMQACLEEAQNMLASSRVERVLVIGSGNSAEISTDLTANGMKTRTDYGMLGMETPESAWLPGAGHAILELMRLDTAQTLATSYQIPLLGLGSAQRTTPVPRTTPFPVFIQAETVQSSLQQALAAAGVRADQVAYLDWCTPGFKPIDQAEIRAMTTIFADRTPTCAIGSSAAIAGYHPNLSWLLSLIQSALLLHWKFLPGDPQGSGPLQPERFAPSSFFRWQKSSPWLTPSGSPRLAVSSSFNPDGSTSHVVLGESPASPTPRVSFLFEQGLPPLTLVHANSLDTLIEHLTTLESLPDAALQDFAVQSILNYGQATIPARYRVVMVGDQPEDLRKEIGAALRGIPNAAATGRAFSTPAGSAFSPAPLGPSARIAFVYPGAFNTYPQLGRDLLTLFPSLHPIAAQFSANPARMMQEEKLYPRSLQPIGDPQFAELESQLLADGAAMIISGSLFAVFFTRILIESFKIQPEAVFGYSLGEIGMVYAMDMWGDADRAASQLRDSPLFQDQLTGEHTYVRRFWAEQGLALPTAEASSPVWENHILMAEVCRVKSALDGRQDVFLTHINTPRQVVIAGSPSACAEIIGGLKCMSVKAPYDFALHNRAMQAAQGELTRLLDFQVLPSAREAALYTALEAHQIDPRTEPLGQAIAAMLCSPLDFVSLIRRVHADGINVFLETGPNNNCTRWIEETLKDEPILAAGVNRRGISDLAGLTRLLARLASHQIPMDLSPLIGSRAFNA